MAAFEVPRIFPLVYVAASTVFLLGTGCRPGTTLAGLRKRGLPHRRYSPGSPRLSSSASPSNDNSP